MSKLKFKYYYQHEETGYITVKKIDLTVIEKCPSCINLARYFVFARCLFTGLQDKNKMDVYEGDILRDALGNIIFVIWESCTFCYRPKGRKEKCPMYLMDLSRWEVVGNINENIKEEEVANA